MKKLFSLLVIAGLAAMISCGPSAEEKAAKEKAKLDSIAKVEKEKKIADSILMVEQAKQDSIVKAKAIEDSIAKAKEQKGNKKPAPKKPVNKITDKKNVKQTDKGASMKKK
jgi:hypothetical protein